MVEAEERALVVEVIMEAKAEGSQEAVVVVEDPEEVARNDREVFFIICRV